MLNCILGKTGLKKKKPLAAPLRREAHSEEEDGVEAADSVRVTRTDTTRQAVPLTPHCRWLSGRDNPRAEFELMRKNEPLEACVALGIFFICRDRAQGWIWGSHPDAVRMTRGDLNLLLPGTHCRPTLRLCLWEGLRSWPLLQAPQLVLMHVHRG